MLSERNRLHPRINTRRTAQTHVSTTSSAGDEQPSTAQCTSRCHATWPVFPQTNNCNSGPGCPALLVLRTGHSRLLANCHSGPAKVCGCTTRTHRVSAEGHSYGQPYRLYDHAWRMGTYLYVLTSSSASAFLPQLCCPCACLGTGDLIRKGQST